MTSNTSAFIGGNVRVIIRVAPPPPPPVLPPPPASVVRARPSGELLQRLGAEFAMSPKEVHKAYRARARELHPDLHPEKVEEMKALTDAYRELKRRGLAV